jgi:hypothetical protein
MAKQEVEPLVRKKKEAYVDELIM